MEITWKKTKQNAGPCGPAHSKNSYSTLPIGSMTETSLFAFLLAFSSGGSESHDRKKKMTTSIARYNSKKYPNSSYFIIIQKMTKVENANLRSVECFLEIRQGFGNPWGKCRLKLTISLSLKKIFKARETVHKIVQMETKLAKIQFLFSIESITPKQKATATSKVPIVAIVAAMCRLLLSHLTSVHHVISYIAPNRCYFAKLPI